MEQSLPTTATTATATATPATTTQGEEEDDNDIIETSPNGRWQKLRKKVVLFKN